MKYLKYYQEAILHRDVDVNIKASTSTKYFGGNPCFVYDNRFNISGYDFSYYFQAMHEPINHWEGVWGYFEKTEFGRELIDRELNLSYSNTLNLMQIISKITMDFLSKTKPNILILNHRNMNNETDDEQFKTKLNKRAKILYNYIKDKIPNEYILSYWYNDYFQMNDDMASTACIIYKQNTDISELIDNRVKIEI